MARWFILPHYPDYHNKPRIFSEIPDIDEFCRMRNTKICRTCLRELALDQYYNLQSSADKLHPDCKDCCKVSRALEAVRKRDKESKISVRQRIRARNLGLLIHDDITLVEVYRKCRGVCYLCNLWVQPRHASMEHKLAYANGGKHEHENVALAHLRCNLIKGDRLYND